MDKSNSTMAQQIAEAASAFEQRRTGHVPESVTVVLSEDTLVVTLHGALSPAEKALAKTPAGAAQVQEFHRQLFTTSSESLRQEIKRITGVEVREATAEVETDDRHCRACLHDRHDGAGVPARSRHTRGNLEREWNSRSIMSTEVQHVGPVEEEQGIGRGGRVRSPSSNCSKSRSSRSRTIA